MAAPPNESHMLPLTHISSQNTISLPKRQSTRILQNSIHYHNVSIHNNVIYNPNVKLNTHSIADRPKPKPKYSTKRFITLNGCGYDRISLCWTLKKMWFSYFPHIKQLDHKKRQHNQSMLKSSAIHLRMQDSQICQSLRFQMSHIYQFMQHPQYLPLYLHSTSIERLMPKQHPNVYMMVSKICDCYNTEIKNNVFSTYKKNPPKNAQNNVSQPLMFVVNMPMQQVPPMHSHNTETMRYNPERLLEYGSEIMGYNHKQSLGYDRQINEYNNQQSLGYDRRMLLPPRKQAKISSQLRDVYRKNRDIKEISKVVEAENIKLKRRLKQLEKQNKNLLQHNLGKTVTEITSNVETHLQNKPNIKSKVIFKLADEDNRASAMVIDKSEAARQKKENDEEYKELHEYKNKVKFAVQLIRAKINLNQLNTIKKAIGSKAQLSQVNGYVSNRYKKDRFQSGKCKDKSLNDKHIRKGTNKWTEWNPSFGVSNNFFSGIVEGMHDIAHVAFSSPGKAWQELIKTQLGSEILSDKQLVHAANFGQEQKFHGKKIPIIQVNRMDALGMPRALGKKTVTILSWQILGFCGLFVNAILTFLIAALIQCGDAKPVTIESMRKYTSLTQEQCQITGQIPVEYNDEICYADLQNMKTVWALDGKCENAILQHMSSGSEFSNPWATKLIPVEKAIYFNKPKSKEEAAIYKQAVIKGYVFESIAYWDTASVSGMKIVDKWDIDKVLDEILEAAKKDPTYEKPEIFTLPMKRWIDPKVAVSDFMMEKEGRDLLPEDQQHKWRLFYGKKYKNGFLRRPPGDVLSIPVPVSCHLIQRVNWDKWNYKLTLQNRMDGQRPIPEIEAMARAEPRLEIDAEKMIKLCEQLGPNGYLKVNNTATKAKLFTHIADQVALVTDKRIDFENDRQAPLKCLRNVTFLYTQESACWATSNMLTDDPNVPYNHPSVTEFIHNGIKRYDTILSMDPKMASPSLFNNLVSGPMKRKNWKYSINYDSPFKFPFMSEADQGTELLGKVMKDYNFLCGSAREGWLTRLMTQANFCHVASIQEEVGKWHHAPSEKKAMHQPLFNGEYDIKDKGFSEMFLFQMDKARKHQMDQTMRDIYSNDLKQFVRGFEDVKGIDMDDIEQKEQSKNVLKGHVKNMENVGNVRPKIQCPHCSKQYIRETAYHTHLRTIHNINNNNNNNKNKNRILPQKRWLVDDEY